MDCNVQPRWDDQRQLAANGDFAALFAELDCPDGGAPIDGGLSRLVHAMEAFKRTPPPAR